MGQIDCPETSVPSYRPTPHKIPQQRRPRQSSSYRILFKTLHENDTFNKYLTGLLERTTYCKTEDFWGEAYNIRISFGWFWVCSAAITFTEHKIFRRYALRSPILCWGCPLLTTTPMFNPIDRGNNSINGRHCIRGFYARKSNRETNCLLHG